MKSYCPECKTVLDADSAQRARCASCDAAQPDDGWPRDPFLDTLVDGGKYRVEALIGAGGFSKVYRVRHTMVRERVLAMKVLHAIATGNPQTEAQFINEMQVLMGFDHPNIVKVTEVGRLAEGQPFILMELLEGRELYDVIQDEGEPFEPARVVKLGVAVASALEVAHGRGVLHRDLKPDNVLMLDDDDLRVIDFGIAKISTPDESGYELSQFIGTPLYMAPEQFVPGGRIDERLDLYQLGAVLHYALTGEPPYRIQNGGMSGLMDIVRQQEERADRLGARPSERRPGVKHQAPKLDTLIAHMLATDPDRRPRDATRVLELFALCEDASCDVEALHAALGTQDIFALEEERAAEAAASGRADGEETLPGTPVSPFAPDPAPKRTPSARASALVEAMPEPLRPLVTGAKGKQRMGIALGVGGGLVAVLLLVAVGSLFGDDDDADAAEPDVVASASGNDSSAAEASDGKAAPKSGAADNAADLAASAARSARFVTLKGGVTVTLGSSRREPGRNRDEAQFKATITRGFTLQATEVTQAQWRAVMGNNPSFFSECGAQCPVERVSWFDALAYLNALSKRDGFEACYAMLDCSGEPGTGCPEGESWCEGSYTCARVDQPRGLDCEGYRLPTEAEWEFAARAGNADARYGDLEDVAWYWSNSDLKAPKGDMRRGTHPVGVKAANNFELYDTLGNVYEWVWDVYKTYPRGTAEDPFAVLPEDTEDFASEGRVNRGCSWKSYLKDCRVADRFRRSPVERNASVGLRVARTLPEDRRPDFEVEGEEGGEGQQLR